MRKAEREAREQARALDARWMPRPAKPGALDVEQAMREAFKASPFSRAVLLLYLRTKDPHQRMACVATLRKRWNMPTWQVTALFTEMQADLAIRALATEDLPRVGFREASDAEET